MKRLFTLSLLLCTSIGVRAQDIPKELLKTWMPILAQNHEGDTVSLEDLNIVTFENRRGVIGFQDRPFNYQLVNDSISIQLNQDVVFKLALLELESQRLILSFDPSMTITYIPLPAFDLRKNINEVIQSFTGEVWSFDIQTRYGTYNLDIDFSNVLEDSALVRPEYLHIAKTAHALSIKDDPILWYITKKEEAVILKIEFMYSSFDGLENFLITDIEKDQIQFSYWEKGKEFHVQAKKWKRKSAHKQFKEKKNLTRQAWRIEKEIIPKSKDSGFEAMLNQYFIEFEAMHDEIDSTLFISQEDIDSRSIILKFEENGAYRIYRESRVLDEGKWGMQFNNTIINLKSHREQRIGDGIFGGYIQLKKLRKNKLLLKRVFHSHRKSVTKKEESLWEIYKPARKALKP